MVYRRQPRQIFETLRYRDDRYRNFSVLFPSSNPLGFPDLEPFSGEIPKQIFPYNSFVRTDVAEGSAVHFFLHDNKFEVCWNNPGVALTRLVQVGTAFSPDFSVFTDWPLAVQQYNIYRSRWCAALWQREGVQVVPTVQWAGPDSFDWCFQGLPRKSVLAVSTVGCAKNKTAMAGFMPGYREMSFRLRPTRVLVYGTVLPEMCRLPQELTYYPIRWKAVIAGGKD